MKYQDISGWRFKAACHALGMSGPDDPPFEAQEPNGIVYWYTLSGICFPRLIVPDDGWVYGEDVEAWCEEVGLDVFMFYIQARDAKRSPVAAPQRSG